MIQMDDIRIWYHDWAGDKLMLMSDNEEVKEVWLQLRFDHPDVVQTLTDPEMDLDEADTDGTMAIIVDTARFELHVDLNGMRFFVSEDEGDE